MGEQKKQLIPELETYLLILQDHHMELLDKEAFLKEAEEMGINGEILYNNVGKVSRRYQEAFSKGRKKADEERFFFASLDFAYLIMAFWMQFMEEPEKWKVLKDEELRRMMLSNLGDHDEELPEQIDAETMLKVLEQIGSTDDVKWKMMIFLQEPIKYMEQISKLVERNLSCQERAVGKVAAPLRKALEEFAKQDVTQLGDAVPAARQMDQQYTYPVLAAPYMDSYVSFEEDVIKRYLGVFAIDFYKLLQNKKKPGEYVQPILKALGDKSKFEIIMSLKESPKYNLEIAEQLGLTPATMSHHMNMLLTCGLVQIEKRDSRVYYCLDRKRIKEFIENLDHVLS